MNRSATIAVFAFFAGLATSAIGDSKPAVMGSTTVSWDEINGKAGKGRSKSVFQAPTATLDELEMHITKLAPGESPHAAHKHAAEEVVIIKEGTLEAMQEGKTRKLGPGSVLFQGSNQMHGVRNVGDVPAIYYVMRWNSPGMLKAAAAAPAARPTPTSTTPAAAPAGK
jgi:XRE family transcriptional regulator, regulator of sulfur utilization